MIERFKLDVGGSENPKHPLERVLLQGRQNSFMRKNSAVFTALGTRTRGTVYCEFLTGEVRSLYEDH